MNRKTEKKMNEMKKKENVVTKDGHFRTSL